MPDDYPPEYDGPEYCDVCGHKVDVKVSECKCPECPGCGDIGNLDCYGQEGHLPQRHFDGENITCMRDLCEFFSAEEPWLLNKRVDDHCDHCGASISVRVADGWCCLDHVGGWVHNGDPAWQHLTLDTPIHGFTIQSIVEGVDPTVDSDEFVLPVKSADVEKWVEYMKDEVDHIWKATHGCEDCWGDRNDEVTRDSEYGYTPVDPDCKACKGDGVII